MRRSKRLPVVDAPALARDARVRADLGREELMITFGFHCNLACTFCLVEDALNVYGGVDLQTTEALLRDPRVTTGVKTILLSGGEVTIERDLERYVALARAVPGVEHVRLQTNAIRLADPAYLGRLRDAGVDQFFVSFHGATAAVCDAITQRPGSFDAILEGMHAIAASGAELMTNTVIVEANYRELEAIADLVVPLRPTRVDFWNYLPRVDRADGRGQLARVTDIRPHLLAALDRCVPSVPRVVVKHYPRCLLDRHAALQDDSQPASLIDDAFWGAYPPYGCLYEGVCTHAGLEGCRGLSFSYVKRFGWEEQHLVPTEPAARRAPGDYWSWSRPSPEPDRALSSEAREAALRALGLEGGVAGWRASTVERHAGALRVALTDGAALVPLELRARDEGAPCFTRTRSMNVTHARLAPELEVRVRPLLAQLARVLAAADRGDAWSQIMAPAPDAALDAWIDALPLRAHPAAARFATAVRAARREGLDRDLVEASLALHEPAFRMHVNATAREPSGRVRPLVALAEAASLPRPLVTPILERWLASAEREAFVGVAIDEHRARGKLYLRAATGDGALTEAAAALGLRLSSPDAHMLGVDFAEGEVRGYKAYSRVAPVAGDERLASIAAGRSRAWYRAVRRGIDGRELDVAVHAEVEGVDLERAAAYAEEAGDAAAAAWLRRASSSTVVRALSASLGRARSGRHVYLAFRRPR